MSFVPFRHKSNGVIAYYPAHYADDPMLSADLERYFEDDDLYEVDKVVDENHLLPVEQRSRRVATPLEDMNVDELKDAARDMNLPVSGTKAELIERLADADATDEKDNK